jgi:hypothetical protein
LKQLRLALLSIAVLFWGAQSVSGQTCAPAPAYRVPIDQATKAAILDSVYASIEEMYVFPSESDGLIRQIAKRFEGGAYDSLNTTDAFAMILTRDLRSISNDLHFAVVVRPQGSKADFCAAAGTDQQALKEINYGFKTVQVMPGNIGYLELTACTDAALGRATASAAMQFLSGVDALIIDLRSNGGGVTSMGLYLASYLFEPGKLMHSLSRRDSKELEHYHTAAHVDGGRLLDIPVYILTSSKTASSAESFAYDLKHHGRAIIVGELTAGAGHCAELARYEFEEFQLDVMVPVYQPIHPVTGSNWEGSGVEPDIKVSSGDALDVAHKKALQTLQPYWAALVNPVGAPAPSSCPPNFRIVPRSDFSTDRSQPAADSRAATQYLGNEEAVINEILTLFEDYDVVHIGERHWNMTDYNFRTALVEHPRFVEEVDDIVIESGNYLYQDLLDDYILKLKDIPDDTLCKVWRDFVLPRGTWDATIYKDFVITVRRVNESLPREKRIRLIAAEPPIDWSKVTPPEEIAPFYAARSTHTPKVIESEILRQDRKALVIYGGAHFFRTSNVVSCAGRLRADLENRMGGKVFVILPLSGENVYSRNFHNKADVDKLPYFVRVKESKLASFQGDLFFGEANGTLEDFTDGVLYFGLKPDAVAEYDPVAANDLAYQKELKRREALFEKITCTVEPRADQ